MVHEAALLMIQSASKDHGVAMPKVTYFHEATIEDVAEGQTLLDVSIRQRIFSDIRDFTAHSEKNLPYDVVHMLNRYFTVAVEPILNNNGFIDKYIDDGILAAFGTRDEAPGAACRNAVRAGLDMLEAARRLGPTFEREFNAPLRIGIHFGTVILGRVGHPGKRQITVIGDTVNTACRVESMTKELGVPILLTEEVVTQLPDALKLGDAVAASLKGKGRTDPLVSAPRLHSAQHHLPGPIAAEE
jgi:class 3 adenylate cyclase